MTLTDLEREAISVVLATAGGHDERMSVAGYESWFVSARDPASSRALWIRHTKLRSRQRPETVALWCTVAGRDLAGPPVVVKQVFVAFPADAAAGAGAVPGPGRDGRAQRALGPGRHR